MRSPKSNQISRFLIAILMTISLTGCRSQYEDVPLQGLNNEMIMQVVLPYAITLQHDKKLRFEDSSVTYGGQGAYIEKMRLVFTSQSILELREARGLLVDVVEGLLDNLNNDPILAGYPLSSENLEICIKFESFLGFYVDPLYIHWMMLQDNNSFFYAFDITNEFSRKPLLSAYDAQSECWHERVEPFYMSSQIVAIERAAEIGYKEMHPQPKSLFSTDRYDGSSLETNRGTVSIEF